MLPFNLTYSETPRKSRASCIPHLGEEVQPDSDLEFRYMSLPMTSVSQQLGLSLSSYPPGHFQGRNSLGCPLRKKKSNPLRFEIQSSPRTLTTLPPITSPKMNIIHVTQRMIARSVEIMFGKIKPTFENRTTFELVGSAKQVANPLVALDLSMLDPEMASYEAPPGNNCLIIISTSTESEPICLSFPPRYESRITLLIPSLYQRIQS